jgi:hypothetical protein
MLPLHCGTPQPAHQEGGFEVPFNIFIYLVILHVVTAAANARDSEACLHCDTPQPAHREAG